MKVDIKKYTAISIVVCIAVAAILLSGCDNLTGNKSVEKVVKSSEKNLTSFVFKQSNNEWLSADIVGIIDEASHSVRITVPEAAYKQTDPVKKGKKKFKASFTVSPKAKLYKGTAEQQSDVMEELFIKDRAYKVVAEDGSSQIYTVYIKVEYETPAVDPSDAETIKKFCGSYFGKLDFDHHFYDICVVYDQEKLSSYSQAMSAVYTNIQWKKVSETEWICRTYRKEDFGRKKENARNTLTFKLGADGKVTCKLVVNAMENAPSDEMKKGADYIWAPDDGKGFKKPDES